MQSRDSEAVPCASLRVYDQVFGRYRPLKGAEKWSCDHHENWKFACVYMQIFNSRDGHIDTRIKNSLIPKMLFFSIYEGAGKNVSEQ